MKKLILIFTTILIYSCGKEHPLQSQIEGEWRWNSTYSGWGSSNTNTSDTQWRLSINSANIVSAREGANSLVQSSSYHIADKGSYTYIKSNDHIYGCSGNAIEFYGDSMVISSPNIFDAETHIFIRLK